jgi:chromosome segregation ATPase
VSRTEDLESQIETLKEDIQIRDQTLEDQGKDLTTARKQVEEARAQALESEKTLDRVLTNLTEAKEAKAALSSQVAKMQSEVDSLAAEKQTLSEKQKEAHARTKKEEEPSLQVQVQALEEATRFGPLAPRPQLGPRIKLGF